MSIGKKTVLIIFLILLVDQIVKLWIKTHLDYGRDYPILGNWFIIHYTENNGMAFGMELGGRMGKLLLSLFRLVAVGAIGWYIYSLIKSKAHTGLIIAVSMIMAGAIGNILDSAFYGVIFNEVNANGEPLGFLYGRVVDMLYFPIIDGHFPQWFPIWKGEEFIFFRPVFNLADTSITLGVATILLFQKKFFKE
jgi:signal peptidase II